MTNKYTSVKAYVDNLISESGLNLSYDFHPALALTIEIESIGDKAKKYYHISVKRDFDSNNLEELDRLLLGVITCTHVLRYYDKTTYFSVICPLGSNYAYNFNEFTSETRRKVYNKYVFHKMNLSVLL